MGSFGRDTLTAQVKRLRQFVELPARERRLLLRAVALVAAVRIALWTLPFRWVRLVVGASRAVSPELAGMRVSRLAWAVQAAARRIPGASCLTQALALQRLMARAGLSAEVHIGVALSANGEAARGFESHAWLEHRGAIILGDNGELERYAPMVAMRAAGGHRSGAGGRGPGAGGPGPGASTEGM